VYYKVLKAIHVSISVGYDKESFGHLTARYKYGNVRKWKCDLAASSGKLLISKESCEPGFYTV
jgi:hypothetical protein